MLPASTILTMQKAQFAHDKRNHADILSLHKTDRLKHYGLHFCKYVGRLARGLSEPKSLGRTITDAALVSLSAANTLHQNISDDWSHGVSRYRSNDMLIRFADASGRFADACEKIDHLEEFLLIAKVANKDIIHWAIHSAGDIDLDLVNSLRERRLELRDRQFFIED